MLAQPVYWVARRPPARRRHPSMLPAVLCDFLGRASVAVASTRDRRLASQVHWVSGWKMEDDRATVTCLIARGFGPTLERHLQEGDGFALTAEVIGPHETYQFKGQVLAMGPLLPEDDALYRSCQRRFVDAVRKLYGEHYSVGDLERFTRPPELRLQFRVRTVFVQTPGPAAGQRLFPRQEA